MKMNVKCAMLFIGCGVLLLAVAACGPAPTGTIPPGARASAPASAPPDETSIPAAGPTVLPVATSAATSTAAGTIVGSTVAPSATPVPTSAPSGIATAAGPAGALSATDLKYALLRQVGDIFYCDRDQFPVAHGDEAVLAAGMVPTIKQSQPEVYLGILKFLGLAPSASLDDNQTLAVYREYKKLNALPLTAAGDGFKFVVRVPDTTGANGRSGFSIEGTISRSGQVNITKKDPTFLQCPICLAADAQIDTPAGPIAVSALAAGMPVWTQDSAGRRVTGVVLQAAHVAVPATHQVVRLRLADGREVRVSPGHPTADGRQVGDLVTGDRFDGSRVASTARETYDGGATYDLLPSGDSGAYWANGILLGSTLR